LDLVIYPILANSFFRGLCDAYNLPSKGDCCCYLYAMMYHRLFIFCRSYFRHKVFVVFSEKKNTFHNSIMYSVGLRFQCVSDKMKRDRRRCDDKINNNSCERKIVEQRRWNTTMSKDDYPPLRGLLVFAR